ncbi:MAG: hypothetical protein GEU79_19425 [Acidimicrobiia bacterium]|nr:hypothetical protein [Acidimicrobiia bacterium]
MGISRRPISIPHALCLALSLLLVISGCSTATTTESAPPATMGLARAHAHNDYEHERPLLDALSHGFTSVEADVWLSDGDLLVAHDNAETTPDRTLRSLYLDPLSELASQRDGVIFPEGPDTMTLLVDVKSDADPTFEALEDQLAEYENLVTTFGPHGVEIGAVTVVVSGNRSETLLEVDASLHAAYDGRLDNLDTPVSGRVPLISHNWTEVFSWSGTGETPTDEQDELSEIVASAHEAGRRVRFWNTPEREDLWGELVAAGVDMINTDRLAELEEFLLESDPEPATPPLTPWPWSSAGGPW